MLDTLQRRDGDLLAPEELRFIEEFHRLPMPSQALLGAHGHAQGSVIPREPFWHTRKSGIFASPWNR